MQKKILVFTLACMMLLAAVCGAQAQTYTAGKYVGSAMGYGGAIEIEVEVSESEIVNVHVNSNNETLGIGSRAIDGLPAEMIAKQTADVDALSGATVTSKAIARSINSAVGFVTGADTSSSATSWGG